MKYLTLIVIFSMVACQKKVETVNEREALVFQDSMVRSIHSHWKFSLVATNPQVNAIIASWEDWRNYTNELTITPHASLDNLMRKANALVEKAAVLKNQIPEAYNKQETKARLALLETNIQKLDMMLELDPLNVKEINSLLALIQKNTNSIIYQFEEFEIKSNIPTESGEEQLYQTLDTVKRATIKAILPDNNEDK